MSQSKGFLPVRSAVNVLELYSGQEKVQKKYPGCAVEALPTNRKADHMQAAIEQFDFMVDCRGKRARESGLKMVTKEGIIVDAKHEES